MTPEETKAVNNAMELEVKAYNLYMKLLNNSDKKNSQELYSELAKLELKHQALLKTFIELEDFKQAKKRIELEFQNYCEIEQRIDPSDEVTEVIDGFQMAIDMERHAQKVYSKLLENTQTDQLKELFTFLLKEEVNHELLLKEKHDNLFGVNE